MAHEATILGVDVGSVATSIVEITATRRVVVSSDYRFHTGDIRAQLEAMLRRIDLGRVGWVAGTAATQGVVAASHVYESQVAAIAAARHLHPELRSLLLVGGEKFGLLRFAADGRYLGSRGNTPCAAGTGSFLDQQATRLGLRGSAALSAHALRATGRTPKIATRCAVFAKTDLIHAQQEGYSLEAICNGLCQGLATNVADAVTSGEPPPTPVVFAGGVALNEAVRRHLAVALGCDLVTDDCAHLYGALGAAILLCDEVQTRHAEGNRIDLAAVASPASGARRPEMPPLSVTDAGMLLLAPECTKDYHYPTLELRLSSYPDFESEQRYEYTPRHVRSPATVEVDIYEPAPDQETTAAIVGIDIGSTSTKAVLLSPSKRVLGGFYTRTSGQPLTAVQAVLEAIADWTTREQIALRVVGAGTTGSGRKLIGSIIGADLVVDEITAHAKAAYELDPAVDTIIEIGGQDAKFTTLHEGMVTFSVMNNVCAAGTGSFIEEQAQKLGCPLSEYAARAEGVRAPLASDRCTVFMERDINHHLAAGYTVPEILATVLHSVRENYLYKVARDALIGEHVCFQGATAKNRALVAAFEQRIQRPIRVSKYCHLTGALGVALQLAEAPVRRSRFAGLELYRQSIPITGEVCDLCNNHCKITVAEVGSEPVAYGFLCGRDYDTERYVSRNRSGVDLLKMHERPFRRHDRLQHQRDVTIGIPAGLFLTDEMPLWKGLFAQLGVKVVTSERFRGAVSLGKKIAGAELCAPISAYLGHAAHLADRCDYLFLPIYLDAREQVPNARRQYCYYTQFASSLAAGLKNHGVEGKALLPLINHGFTSFSTKANLYKALNPALGDGLTFFEVSDAFEDALATYRAGQEELRDLFRRELDEATDISVCLLGRPYSVLSADMNKGIPEIFGALGIKAFFQDMLTYEKADVANIQDLLQAVHWTYASKALESAEVIGKTEGLYPVLVTSFKCTPDACIIEYFKRILDAHGKPYLVLELDEHDSTVGYETRIEAAVRSFRNHRDSRRRTAAVSSTLPVTCARTQSLEGRILLLPVWDPLVCRLMVANFRHAGVDARLLEEDERTIHKSLLLNTGQCLPMTATAQGAIDYIQKHDLDPGKCSLWVMDSELACNIRLFPHLIKGLLEAHGGGMERVEMYLGDITLVDISLRAAFDNYFAIMLGGYLRRMGCKVRPYEVLAGETDRVIRQSLDILAPVFEDGGDRLEALERVVDLFKGIATMPHWRPKVATFGDLYVRDNDAMNQNVIRTIEDNGGEAITTPYNEYAKLIAGAYFRKWAREGKYFGVVANSTLLAAVTVLEKKYLRKIEEILGPRREVLSSRTPEEILGLFHVTEHHTGESFDNVLEIFHILEECPDISLFVQLNPSFCCPSLVTEAMARDIERVTGVPIVTVTYDGTVSAKNDSIVPYLHCAAAAGPSVQRVKAQ